MHRSIGATVIVALGGIFFILWLLYGTNTSSSGNFGSPRDRQKNKNFLLAYPILSNRVDQKESTLPTARETLAATDSAKDCAGEWQEILSIDLTGATHHPDGDQAPSLGLTISDIKQFLDAIDRKKSPRIECIPRELVMEKSAALTTINYAKSCALSYALLEQGKHESLEKPDSPVFECLHQFAAARALAAYSTFGDIPIEQIQDPAILAQLLEYELRFGKFSSEFEKAKRISSMTNQLLSLSNQPDVDLILNAMEGNITALGLAVSDEDKNLFFQQFAEVFKNTEFNHNLEKQGVEYVAESFRLCALHKVGKTQELFRVIEEPSSSESTTAYRKYMKAKMMYDRGNINESKDIFTELTPSEEAIKVLSEHALSVINQRQPLKSSSSVSDFCPTSVFSSSVTIIWHDQT